MTREEIIRQILRRELEGQSLLEEVVGVDQIQLLEDATELFGSWETALQYSGVSQAEKVNHSLSQEKVMKQLRFMCCRGYNLTAAHNLRRDRAFYNTVRRFFGTWRNALQAVGIRPENATGRSASHMDREMILAWLRERNASGKSIKGKDICLENRDMAMAVKNRFGSWKRARQAAGLDEI